MWSPSRAAKERIAKRRAGTGAAINMWPFASVMVAIVFLFLGDTMPIHRRFAPVDLPQSVFAASEPKALREDAIRIQVSREGNIFFRDVKVAPEHLPDLIGKAVKEGSERRVYFSADARAQYADVKVALNLIDQAGIRDVTILAEKVAPR